MDIAALLSAYGGWGAAGMLIVFGFWLVMTGKLETQSRIERERDIWRTLTSSVERLADAQEESTRALRDVQTSTRNLEEGQRANLHALESFQQARESHQ